MAGFTGASPIVTDGLVFAVDAANYQSYPGSGTTWTDLAGSNDGTLTNGPTFDSGNGGSIAFDGSDDKVTFSSAPSFYTNYTIECIFKADNLPTNTATIGRGLVSWGENTNYKRRALVLWNGGHASYWTVRSSTFSSNPEGTTQIQNNTWYYAAVSLNSSNTCKIYVNGELETTSTNTTSTPTTNTFLLGDTGYPEYLEGNIATAKVYNRVLSSTEVTQNYNALKSRFGL